MCQCVRVLWKAIPGGGDLPKYLSDPVSRHVCFSEGNGAAALACRPLCGGQRVQSLEPQAFPRPRQHISLLLRPGRGELHCTCTRKHKQGEMTVDEIYLPSGLTPTHAHTKLPWWRSINGYRVQYWCSAPNLHFGEASVLGMHCRVCAHVRKKRSRLQLMT